MNILNPSRKVYLGLFLLFALFLFFGKSYLNTLYPEGSLSISDVTIGAETESRISFKLKGESLSGMSGYLSLDSSNKRAIVGSIPLEGFTVDLEIIGKRAFVVGRKDVKIFDLTDPLYPVLLKTYDSVLGWRSDSDASQVFVSTALQGIKIFPATQDSRPYPINTYGRALASIHSGNKLYVAEDTAGISIFTTSGISRYRELGRLDLPGSTQDIALRGEILVAASKESGLHLVDVSEPETPRLLKTLSGNKVYERVWFVGDIVYAADKNRQIDLYRLSGEQLHFHGSIPLFGYLSDFVLDGDRLYLAEASYGVIALDIKDPSNPGIIGVVGMMGSPSGLAIYNDYLYVASSSQGVQIVDKNRFAPLRTSTSYSSARDFVLDGRWIYVADDNAGLQILDRSDEKAFKRVATLPTKSKAMAIEKAEDTVYLTLLRGGLIAVDVSNPLRPELVSSIEEESSFSDLAVRGTSLFVSSYANKLLEIDISDPAHLEVVESVELPGRPRRIDVQGDNVYVAAEKAGLLIVNSPEGKPGVIISQINRPWPMSKFSKAFDVVVSGNYAYLVQAEEGLLVIDIRDPENPIERQVVTLPDNGLSLNVSDDYAVVSSRWSGFYFIDITQPETAFLAAKMYLPRSNGYGEVEGRSFYSASRSNGINVIPLPIKSTSGTGSSELFFERPRVPGWYDLSVSDGTNLIIEPSVMRVDQALKR